MSRPDSRGVAARRWMAGAVVVTVASLGLGACGAGGHRAVPATAPSRPNPTTIPGPTAPAGDRLAIATSDGMEVWSPSTGVFTVGPTRRGVRASDVAWSADGLYLSWQTAPAATPRRGVELWYAALESGITHHWGPLPAGQAFGPVVVTDSGVLTFGTTITRYSPATGRRGVPAAVTTAPDPVGSPVQSWLRGWVVEPGGSPTGQSVVRVATAGAVLAPGVVLDGGTSVGPHFDLGAVDGGGRHFAAELGQHGAGCETAGTAQLWTASLPTDVVHFSTPPSPAATDTLRFWDVDVSGAAGVVYGSTFTCGTRGPARGRVLATVLWRYRAGRWSRLGAHLVAADQAAGGPLATIGGDIRLSRGVAGVVGTGAVSVGGRVVATGGQAIAWAPVRPKPPST